MIIRFILSVISNSSSFDVRKHTGMSLSQAAGADGHRAREPRACDELDRNSELKYDHEMKISMTFLFYTSE